MKNKLSVGLIAAAVMLLATLAPVMPVFAWSEAQFSSRPLLAYPAPRSRNDIVGSLTMYKIRPGDTLLDIGRWYGLSAKEVSDANNHLDWWAPPAGKEIILPTAHILPDAPHTGIVLNIPEMRLYYYYPSPVTVRRKGKLISASFSRSAPSVVYTFPVGLGRFDWKTPVGTWTVTGKTINPTWVVPQDIYEEHLERDGEAEHVIPGGEDDNPLGHYRLSLSLPEYALHGTDVPWGVGMNVSHGCVRLYPEDIEHLFYKVRIGTPGRFVYQPIKFGWRGDSLYVEVHDDLYAMYPGLWNHAVKEVNRLAIQDQVDMDKLEKAVEARSGIPTYVMPGPAPADGLEVATVIAPPSSAPQPVPSAPQPIPASVMSVPAASSMPASTIATSPTISNSSAGRVSAPAGGSEWESLPDSRIINDNDDDQ